MQRLAGEFVAAFSGALGVVDVDAQGGAGFDQYRPSGGHFVVGATVGAVRDVPVWAEGRLVVGGVSGG